MNWARGLFRLWVVATVLWFIICAAAAAIFGPSSWDDFKCAIGVYDAWCDSRRDVLPTRITLLVIVAVPAIVLAMGASLLWAMSGFRRQPSRSASPLRLDPGSRRDPPLNSKPEP